jgi:hypothetical protein
VDERSNTIIGLVSKTYVTYSNGEFVADIERLLSSVPKDQRFNFHEGFGVNTELTLRFTSVKHHGIIRGRGGEGEDKTAIGLDFKNSMVGNTAVRINCFLHRLICANGLMVPAAEVLNRVFHSGQRSSLRHRLDRSFAEVTRSLSRLPKLLDTLGAKTFAPEALAKNRSLVERIFDVVPGSKRMIAEKEDLYVRYPEDIAATERERLRREHDAAMIDRIPKYLGGELSQGVFKARMRESASLFDFINVFTEHANSKRPAERLEIQEKAGALADYLAANSRKF